MRRFCFVCLGLVAAVAIVSCRRPIPTAPDREAIATTVTAFHEALAGGDSAAAMALLAPDAQVLESGHRETREEYSGKHLAADMEFTRAVQSTRGAMIVRQEGNVAWTSTTSLIKGQFRGKDVQAESAELMVLGKTEDGWRIRAIHWSTHEGGGGH